MSSLSSYLKEISQTPLLTADEEQQLAKKIQNKKDDQAREQMMKANLRLVVNVAKRYVPSNDPDALMDLIQEGNVGLMRAVDRFEPGRGTRFSTYGVYWIKQAILRSLKQRRLMRLPENVVDQVQAMKRKTQQLYQLLGRMPEPAEIANEMEISLARLRQLEEAAGDVISLDSNIKSKAEGEETPLKDLLEDIAVEQPEETVKNELIRDAVFASVRSLPVRERQIVEMRFGLKNNKPQTLEKIGEEFGISRERVRQLQNTALGRLKERQQIKRAMQA